MRTSRTTLRSKNDGIQAPGPIGREEALRAVSVCLAADGMTVRIEVGGEVAVSYAHFPRLSNATAAQRRN
jgi:hypothetical protein